MYDPYAYTLHHQGLTAENPVFNSNQAFSHDRCNIFFGLSYIKANNTFLNSVRKKDCEAQVEFSFKI